MLYIYRSYVFRVDFPLRFLKASFFYWLNTRVVDAACTGCTREETESPPRACAHRTHPVRGGCLRWTSAALAILWNGRAFRRRLALRNDAVRIDAASRRASRGNARARYRSFYRSQHLDRSSGSLIRESRIFGQIGSFSAGMARRTPVGPVRHLCRWVSHGRRPREHAGEREHRGKSGEGVSGCRFPREEGCKRVGDVSQPSTGFLISRGRPSTRRDAMRRRDAPARPTCASWRKHFRQSADV